MLISFIIRDLKLLVLDNLLLPEDDKSTTPKTLEKIFFEKL